MQKFVEKWSRAGLTEAAASHEHFLDQCRLLESTTRPSLYHWIATDDRLRNGDASANSDL